MASDTGSGFLYVVDKLTSLISTFAVQSTGALSLQATTATGSLPSALTIFNDQYMYVTNSGDSTITTYSVSSGNLARLSVSASDTQPIAITVDPRKLGFLYTVNFLGNSLSGYKIDASTGALVNAKNSPFASTVQPTAIAGIPHNGTVTK
jgi:6-phosphogluconolactonase (cycloisomerase 2 family)